MRESQVRGSLKRLRKRTRHASEGQKAPGWETRRFEDYLEAIYRQTRDRGYTCTTDLSEELGVKSPTVTSMLKKLARDGYLLREPYRGMRLTEKGLELARVVTARKRVLSDFLSTIGAEEDTAPRDEAERELWDQPSTIRRIERLIGFLRNNPKYLDKVRDCVGK